MVWSPDEEWLWMTTARALSLKLCHLAQVPGLRYHHRLHCLSRDLIWWSTIPPLLLSNLLYALQLWWTWPSQTSWRGKVKMSDSQCKSSRQKHFQMPAFTPFSGLCFCFGQAHWARHHLSYVWLSVGKHPIHEAVLSGLAEISEDFL